jgi:hypothetical protein
VAIELAEAAAEVDVLLASDLLVPEKQDAVIEESVVDLAEERFTHRLAHVDAADFGAEGV